MFLGEEIKQQYQQLAQALDEYVRKMFNEWTTTVEKDTNNMLDVPLMCRSTHQLGMLELNFDRSVCLFLVLVKNFQISKNLFSSATKYIYFFEIIFIKALIAKNKKFCLTLSFPSNI